MLFALPHGCCLLLLLGGDFRADWLSTLVHAEAACRPTVAEAHGDTETRSRACAAHGCDFQTSARILFIAGPNVRGKRPDAVDGKACVVQHNRAHHAGPDGRRSGSA